MQTKDQIVEKANSHNAPRTVQLIIHARVFNFTDGWNELSEYPEVFQFDQDAFNFDYLLYLSGINYLIHPDDIQQVIGMVQMGSESLVEFNLRFINRIGEIRVLSGLTSLVEKH